MIKYISIALTGGILLATIPGSLLADENANCPTWQTNPTSVSISDLTSTSISDITDCMRNCDSYTLSTSSSDTTPALCSQNVSYIEYLAEFSQNTQNPNITLPISSSSTQSTAPQSTAPQLTAPQSTANSSSNTLTTTNSSTQPTVHTNSSSPPASDSHSKHLINWL